jgi:hypothetical protein
MAPEVVRPEALVAVVLVALDVPLEEVVAPLPLELPVEEETLCPPQAANRPAKVMAVRMNGKFFFIRTAPFHFY